ncbi:MAG TPA: GNAT family N-acetyltransferase [Thermoanaerobaculia bacterium]
MIRTLTSEDFESLYAAFTAAFSDYVVPLVLTREQLAEMIARRGWVPELSVGAFDGDAMVAFTINCVEDDRAYDSGTGVVPSHRRQGLGRELMERSFELLRERCREYVLEVIDRNERAVELYLATGFEVTRGLQCWGYESSSLPVAESSSSLSLDDLKTRRLDDSDVEPSWQNSDGSIRRSTQEHVTLGDDRGYAIVFPDRGDLAQLAVRRDARRQGIGTRLLQAAAAVAGKPLRIINVDERDLGIAAFLEHNGAKRTVRQVEMSRPLR